MSARHRRGAPVQYPVRAVSKLTGIGADTLRAWERRYGAVSPRRADRARMYTEADVDRLRLLKQAVSSGHRIGQVARLTTRELRRLAPAAAVAVARPAPRSVLDVSALKTALATLDTAGVDREASRLAATLHPVELVRDALLPVLRDVGDQWHARRDGIALEHVMSSTLRHLFGSFLRIYGRHQGSGRLLFATPAGDHHEIGILAAAMLAASHGFAVSYVGPDLPASAVVEAVRTADAHVLVLGVTFAPDPARRARDLRAIRRALPSTVEFWIGGRDADRCAPDIGGRGVALRDFDTYLGHLARLGACGG